MRRLARTDQKQERERKGKAAAEEADLGSLRAGFIELFAGTDCLIYAVDDDDVLGEIDLDA